MEKLTEAILGFAALGFIFVQVKNWLEGRKIVQLADEDKALFKQGAATEGKIKDLQDEAEAIPAQEEAKSEQQAVDEWNK